MNIVNISRTKLSCQYCETELTIKSQFICGDINKELKLVTDYRCSKCNFKPVKTINIYVKELVNCLSFGEAYETAEGR